jgi:hypothetical protein
MQIEGSTQSDGSTRIDSWTQVDSPAGRRLIQVGG